MDNNFRAFLIGSRNLEYPWIFTVLRTERKMAHRFAKVLEEEIEEASFYPSDLVNTKATTPSGLVRSGGYIPQRFASRYIYISPLFTSPSGNSCILFVWP